MGTTTQPTIRTPGEGRTIAVVGDVYRFLVTGEETNGKYAMWEAIPANPKDAIDRCDRDQCTPMMCAKSPFDQTAARSQSSGPARDRLESLSYRSISPITTSSEPTIAGMSAIRQPAHKGPVTDRLQNDELLARARRGLLESFPTR